MATATLTRRVVMATEERTASLRDRRHRSRAPLLPMYSSVVVRVLNQRRKAIEGHALNISEMGIAVTLDDLIAPGSPVTIEFSAAGLGRERAQGWPTFVATAEVLRNDDVDDFPQGPYTTALRFIRIPTILQAQIARYVAAHGGSRI